MSHTYISIIIIIIIIIPFIPLVKSLVDVVASQFWE